MHCINNYLDEKANYYSTIASIGRTTLTNVFHWLNSHNISKCDIWVGGSHVDLHFIALNCVSSVG